MSSLKFDVVAKFSTADSCQKPFFKEAGSDKVGIGKPVSAQSLITGFYLPIDVFRKSFMYSLPEMMIMNVI